MEISLDDACLPLRTRLNLETARIDWSTLERFFAGGKVIHVHIDVDLIEVAAGFVEDNATAIKQWMDAKQVSVLSDDTARQWVSTQPDNLWAVVVAPWVLVQQR